MRVTNSMITNSSQQHITNAKNLFLKYQTQYASQKKIQRPSDDPTIAVRALQLRTTYTQIRQYASKNVSDAMDWMDSTETALKNANTTLKNMKGYLNQGANDYLESDQRNSVLSVLQEYVSSIFEDEANTDYSGRYVFSGYRTDTSLIFPTDTDNLEYKISESFSSKAIDTIKYVTSNVGYVAGNGITDYSDQLASQDTAYRLQLSYRNCSNSAITGDNTVFNITTSYKNAAGTTVTDTLSSAVVSSDDPNAYDVDAYNKANGTNFDTIYLYDTGTVIFGAQAYSDVQMNNATILVDYTKKEFENQNIYEHMVGKVSWMHIELEDFGVNIIEFIDSHEEGSYKEINRLIKSVNQGEIQAVLVWDFNEIPLELRISLVEECSKRNVYIDGFLTSLEIKDNN